MSTNTLVSSYKTPLPPN